MTDRDKLIELVNRAKDEYANDVTDHTETDYIVECLLNNGVIVPMCYVGQKIWYVCKHYYGDIEVIEGKISMIQQKSDKSWKFRFSHNSSVWDFKAEDIGVRYFTTEEEAQQKAKELNKND